MSLSYANHSDSNGDDAVMEERQTELGIDRDTIIQSVVDSPALEMLRLTPSGSPPGHGCDTVARLQIRGIGPALSLICGPVDS